jgi:hypothetical protein
MYSRHSSLATSLLGVLLAACSGSPPAPTTAPTTAPIPAPTAAATVPATPTPTVAPTATPTPAATPVADPIGHLSAGTYVAHPFPQPNRAMSFTFEITSNVWDTNADPGMLIGISRDDVGLGFLQVSSLNGDPCEWSGETDDVAVGSTVDDLVSALGNETEYDTSAASDVSVSGYSGKKVAVTMPDTLNPNSSENLGCDEGNFRIWNATGFDIYAQGPENRWTMWILDVEGQRVVVMTSDYAESSAANRAGLQSIVDSMVITAP